MAHGVSHCGVGGFVVDYMEIGWMRFHLHAIVRLVSLDMQSIINESQIFCHYNSQAIYPIYLTLEVIIGFSKLFLVS